MTVMASFRLNWARHEIEKSAEKSQRSALQRVCVHVSRGGTMTAIVPFQMKDEMKDLNSTLTLSLNLLKQDKISNISIINNIKAIANKY